MGNWHIPQEYDGNPPVVERGSWDLRGIHDAEHPQWLGNFLNEKAPFRNFLGSVEDIEVRNIHLVQAHNPYTGIAPIDIQPAPREVKPYDQPY